MCEQSQHAEVENCCEDDGMEKMKRNTWQSKAVTTEERVRLVEGEKWVNQTREEEIVLIFGLLLISLVVELSAKCQG